MPISWESSEGNEADPVWINFNATQCSVLIEKGCRLSLSYLIADSVIFALMESIGLLVRSCDDTAAVRRLVIVLSLFIFVQLQSSHNLTWEYFKRVCAKEFKICSKLIKRNYLGQKKHDLTCPEPLNYLFVFD